MADRPTDRSSASSRSATCSSELSQETSTLVKQEMALARAELTEQGKRAGKGAGMLGGAGVAGLLMLGALTATVIGVLDTAMAPGWPR